MTSIEPTSVCFDRKIEEWKAELLDLSARNRALRFRDLKSTLEIPVPADEVWALATDTPILLSPADFAPGSSDPLADSRFQQAFAAAGRLLEKTRLIEQEQGVATCFAVVGWLDWRESPAAPLQRSPLMLIPVRLGISQQRRTIRLDPTEDEPELNPALRHLLRTVHGVILPEPPQGATLDRLFSPIRRAIEQQPGWEVATGRPVLDSFSFAKLALVEEIDRSRERLAAHPILVALACGDWTPEVSELPGLSDDESGAEPLRVVIDADASQMRAVAMAARGRSFVLEGPPGTGKSQTITNMCAELMAQGKRVLFVAEKRIARDVVFENLTKADVAGACLHLAANTSAGNTASYKAQVVRAIVDAYRTSPPPPPDPQTPERIEGLTRRLNDHVRALSAPLGREGWLKLVTLIGRAEQLRNFRSAGGPPELADCDRYWLSDLVDDCGNLDDLGASKLSSVLGPWAGLRATEVTETNLLSTLATLAGFPDDLIAALAGMLSSDATVLASDLDAAAHLVMAVGALAAYRRSAASPLRWILPNYYRFRSAPETHAELGLAETGREQDEAPRLRSLQRGVETALGALQSAFSDAPGRNEPLAALAQWASRLVHDEAGLRALIEVRHVLALLERHHAKAFVGEVLAQAVAHTKPTRSVEATAYAEWAERALRRTSDLLSPEAHARLVGQYGEADRDLRLWARRSVMHAVVNKRPSANSGEMTRLEQFDRAQRRPALRKMLAETRGAVQGIKPCILVSPLAVAQYLCHKAGRDYQFDVCIVDEASMVPTADMVVAISLAPQLIVCGDSKQMPPTDFFRKVISSNDDDDPDDDPGAVAPIKFESVLDECAPLLRPSAELTYHYRSRDETLIAFSNAHFYGGRLIAFPDCWEQREESGVKFEFVPDGVYGRGGTTTNPQEARRVVELLRAERARWPDRSVAITAMSTAQQAEIQARLYDLASLDPIVRLWSESGGRARNLETIQGDECDTMILSVGYGKDAAGKLTMNFGPLGRAKGERRLNVAVTRARWKSILVSSIHATDINPTSTSPEGLLRLRDYLDYAERGEIALSSTIRVNAGADTESPFEAAVLAELMRRGLDCVPQVGVGKYRIDIGIRDPDVTGRFLLGVECDGAMYHSAPTARDRDLLRERVLTNMGWEIARVWSTAWFQDPEREVQRLLERFQAAVRRQQSSSN